MNLAIKNPKELKLKTRLGLILVFLVVMMGLALRYVYFRMLNALGDDAAVIILAILIAGELFLIVVGIRLGKALDDYTSEHPLKPDRKLTRLLQFLGFGTETEDVEEADLALFQSDESLFDDVEALLVLIEEKKHRGKKSNYAPEVRFRAVRDWMLLQAKGNPMKLLEFLEERFGVAPESGMPLVPNQTFYGWRTKYIKELKKLQAKKKKQAQ
ncbi:MAG: hypothetical protein HOE06_06180 [Candidatus Thioglobus sp.]|jgi:hypothetical protein|nr:hypothetical protein [Candidatus Thioglobus sp.]